MKMSASAVIIFSAVFIIICLFDSSQAASFEDTRCKCVCDKTWDANGKKTRAVFTNTTRSEYCDCEHVVHPISPLIPCSRCLCKTETRNTTTIKVVVIFIICVVLMLFVYMLFLLCLDPIIQRRPANSYQQHTNEEVNLEDLSSDRSGASIAPVLGTSSDLARQRSLINIVQKEQKKWKGTVVEQRKNIYDRHSMLN
ncbi:transmembrane protein 9 [Plakobranchus ocellatus]|uniref:Transmembrane protein 9 n=1 Tax=Plakobranchus ocellatus TaxID=259542 RepID=A0AAV4B986_9GAST|nr:transmembrane protein 9 [Plakobranchus ocellatus]